MNRRLLACALAALVLVGGCSAEGADEAAEQQAGQTTGATGADDATDGADGAAMFGTLESPCGPGDATVKADEAGRGTDKLYVGTGNDRASEIRSGLLAELWDTATAFTKWCNEQGGIEGLQIENVDLDGKLLEIEAAMATACTDVFALVGGGWAQDNLIFTGKDGSDFHKCKLIAIPGFAVSTDVSEGNGIVQPIPNPAYVRPTDWFQSLAKLYPDEVKNFGIIYGDIPSIAQNKEQNMAVAKATEGFGNFAEISYNPITGQDWGVIAQQARDKGLQAIIFIGEPGNMSKASQALKDQNYEGVLTGEANQYDQLLIDSSGPDAVEGVISRLATHPYEEADKWPATEQLLEILKAGNPAGKIASLNVQAFSAWLLFAKSVKECAAEGEVTRDCVISAAAAVKDWDGGGLHTPTDPGENTPAECSLLMQIRDGKYVRLYPELGSDDDQGEGFSCGEPPTITITGDLGKGNVDPTRTA